MLVKVEMRTEEMSREADRRGEMRRVQMSMQKRKGEKGRERERK